MGGPVTIAGLITALSRYERVSLLYLRGRDEPPIDERVRKACECAVEVPRLSGGRALRGGESAAQRALCALGGTPSWVAEWHVPEYRLLLEAFVARWQPDIVQAEFHLMAQYVAVGRTSGAVTVVTQHEPGAAAYADRRRAGLLPGAIMPLLEERAWERYERAMARQVDAIVAFTERDREVIRSQAPEARIKVIALGADVSEPALNPRGHGRPALLFFGNYLHAPNVDAAARLATSIFPILEQAIPESVLWLVGDHPPPELQRLASERVLVPGRVEDLTSCLDAAAVVLAPLRMGGGMRVKVTEALAAGKAVIATRLAVAGLNVIDGEHVTLAETDEEFARAAQWLIENPDARAGLATRGRAWASVHLSWDRTAAQYAALHEELLAERVHARCGAPRDV